MYSSPTFLLYNNSLCLKKDEKLVQVELENFLKHYLQDKSTFYDLNTPKKKVMLWSSPAREIVQKKKTVKEQIFINHAAEFLVKPKVNNSQMKIPNLTKSGDIDDIL